ncbi:MAG: tyrosine--tRNA ligase [Armatimonadetes bacterium]|nr:tyrosine--tRNA ligase [Armatimonadota bacterium]
MSDVFQVLRERGYVAQTSDDDAVAQLLAGRTTIYEGFDPTSDSLTIGHLLSLMAMRHLQQAGHRILFLLGGFTAIVGDPTGKSETRQFITPEDVRANGEAIRRQVQALGLVDFEHPENPALMLNNFDWLEMSLSDYMLHAARYFSVNRLLTHETYQDRLARQEHLSLMEFLYSTLQGYDYLHLYRDHGCRLQIGGNDQWRNILDGIELIQHVLGEQAYALTFELLLDPCGQKMGKTSTGTRVWLEPARTSPFEYYQYWVNAPDQDVERNFKVFTFLPLDEIAAILRGHPREAQHRLALEATRIVHGEQAARRAQADSRAAFAPEAALPEDVPTVTLSDAELAAGVKLVAALGDSGVVKSRGEARRLIQQGGVRLWDERVADTDRTLTSGDFRQVDGVRAALLRAGKGKVLKVVLG